MARTDRGPSFAQRVARSDLTPTQRETSRATLLLAELVAELLDEIREQNDRVAVQNDRLTEQNALLEEIRDRQPPAVTYNITDAGGGTDEGKGGGGDVQLREPAVPPPDPDDTADSGGSVAEPATSKPTARRATAKTAARTAPAKATKAAAAARGSTSKTGGGKA